MIINSTGNPVKLGVIIFFLLLTIHASAQQEGNIWYFGNKAGIDFNSGSPVVLTDGALNSIEGCSSISGPCGNLLFYTDGVKVWNKNHLEMPNGIGLGGHNSSTQSALILQKPGSNNLYYIFTTDASGNSNGFRYSMVDMKLENGLGDVISKSNLIYQPVAEKLTAVRHANGIDVWIIVHEWGTDAFHAYLVDSTGISVSPIISSIGEIYTGNRTNSVGQLKASPDGSKLAVAIYTMNIFELFDFNNTTGQLSNLISFPPIVAGSGGEVYGVEFSPDGSKLYGNIFNGRLYQWNLMAGDIIKSRVIVGTSSGEYGSLQLGPDGKIYCARNYASYLAVINEPNVLGTLCNYVENALFLNRECWMGLPNYNQSYINPAFTFKKDCNAIIFSITDTFNLDSLHWDFGDPASGPLNTSTDLNPYHIYNASGNYSVKLTKYSAKCPSFSETIINFSVSDSLELETTGEGSICIGESITIGTRVQGGLAPYSYNWEPGALNDSAITVSPSVSTSYTIIVKDANNCTVSPKTVNVHVNTLPDVSFKTDTARGCKPLCVSFNHTSSSSNVVNWTFGDGESSSNSDVSHCFIKSGNYDITLGVTDSNSCYNSLTVPDMIHVFQSPVAEFMMTPSLYSPVNSPVLLTDQSTGATQWIWNFGDSLSSKKDAVVTYTQPGHYSIDLIVTNAEGCMDTVFHTIYIELGFTLYIPNAFTPDNDGLNDFFFPKVIEFSDFEMEIYNRWGEKIYHTLELDKPWGGNSNNGIMENGIYAYKISVKDLRNRTYHYAGNVVLIR